jgi:hypothetical protein
VPVLEQVGRGRQGLSWLVIWIAVILAAAPLARPHLRIRPVPAPLSDERFGLVHRAVLVPAVQTPARPQPDRPRHRILPRLPEFSAAPSPLFAKLPPIRPDGASEDLAAPETSAAWSTRREEKDAFHRSSVGTARTPTGPPARLVSS